MTDHDLDTTRREKLRAAFTALAELDAACPPETHMAEGVAVETAQESLKLHFGKDYLGTCEGCSCILLEGDHGQRCVEGEYLCMGCAASWADIKEQWDTDALDEDEPGDKAKFLARYDAHIAAGGSPTDLLTYPL